MVTNLRDSKEINEKIDRTINDPLDYLLVDEIPSPEQRIKNTVYSNDENMLLLARLANSRRIKEGETPFDTSILSAYKDKALMDENRENIEDGGSGGYDPRKDLIIVYNLDNVFLLEELADSDFLGDKPKKSLDGFFAHENQHREFNKFFKRPSELLPEAVYTIFTEAIAYGMQVLRDKKKYRVNPPKTLYEDIIDEEYVEGCAVDNIAAKYSNCSFPADNILTMEMEDEKENIRQSLRSEIKINGQKTRDYIIKLAEMFVLYSGVMGLERTKNHFFQPIQNGQTRKKRQLQDTRKLMK